MSVEERDALRSQILNELYDAEIASPRTWFDARVWAASHDRSEAEVLAAFRWLQDRELVRSMAWGMIGIAPAGVDAVEAQRREPAQSDEAAAEVVTIAVFRQLEAVVAELRAFIDEHEETLEPDELDDLRAQADTIDAQRRSPRARASVIRAALQAARYTVDNAAAGMIGAGTIEGVRALLRILAA